MMDYNVLHVNLDAVASNIKALKKCQTNKKLIGVIKANGYGCGDVALAKVLQENGASLLAVSSIKEAIHLRKAGIDMDILVLGVTFKEDIPLAKEYNIILTIPGYDYCLECNMALADLRCHIKLDTGMNRLGCKSEREFGNCISLLTDRNASIEGVFTHFAKSDDRDDSSSNLQMSLFKRWVNSSHYIFSYVHCDNTDATIKYQEEYTNAFRVGLGLLGFSSTNYKLTPAVTLTTVVTSSKEVKPAERVGYGLTHMFMDEGYVSTLPIGYDDGFLRANQNRNVYVNGSLAPIVGRVCMDQCMIFTKKRLKRGDIVEIFGTHISLNDMANQLNTISYEVLCLLSDRITREYTYHGKVCDKLTPRFTLEKLDHLN